TGILRHAFPQLNDRADARVVGKPCVEFRLVRVMQHIHHVGAANAGRVIETGVLEAARLEVGNALVGPLLHLVLGAEYDRLRRTGLLTRRPLADRDTIGAERALVGLVIDLGDARDVERAPLHAIAAADTVLVDEIHDAVGVLDDRAWGRAGLEATRVL